MLGQRLRSWPSIKPTLGHHMISPGKPTSHIAAHQTLFKIQKEAHLRTRRSRSTWGSGFFAWCWSVVCVFCLEGAWFWRKDRWCLRNLWRAVPPPWSPWVSAWSVGSRSWCWTGSFPACRWGARTPALWWGSPCTRPPPPGSPCPTTVYGGMVTCSPSYLPLLLPATKNTRTLITTRKYACINHGEQRVF